MPANLSLSTFIIYNFPLTYYPEVCTGASVSESDSHLTGIFLCHAPSSWRIKVSFVQNYKAKLRIHNFEIHIYGTYIILSNQLFYNLQV